MRTKSKKQQRSRVKERGSMMFNNPSVNTCASPWVPLAGLGGVHDGGQAAALHLQDLGVVGRRPQAPALGPRWWVG